MAKRLAKRLAHQHHLIHFLDDKWDWLATVDLLEKQHADRKINQQSLQ